MRSSKLIIKHNAQKKMARFVHDLNYLELDLFFIFLEFTINLRSSSENL